MKKLHISNADKVFAGVCGGLSESIGINANIIRGIFLISIFLGFSGLWIYLILMVIMPKQIVLPTIIEVEIKDEEEEENKIIRPWNGRIIAGVCKGFENYLQIDVTIIRLVFIFAGLVSGVGIVLYILFWFIFPNEK